MLARFRSPIIYIQREELRLVNAIQTGRESRITMKPKVCVSTPQGDGEPSKEVLGGGSLFSNVSSIGNGLTNGFDCCNGVLSKAPRELQLQSRTNSPRRLATNMRTVVTMTSVCVSTHTQLTSGVQVNANRL